MWVGEFLLEGATEAERVEELAQDLYEAYCGAFLSQKTLRPKHPGQMPLARWSEQRDEIRACWREVARALLADPPRCAKAIEVWDPSVGKTFETTCALMKGHERPCGAFLVSKPEPPAEALTDLMASMRYRCTHCGRKSNTLDALCGMTQPDGSKCGGTIK